MDTEKVAAFKGIYLEETRQYYLCDFRRNLTTHTYRINIDLPGKIIEDVIFSKDPQDGHWQGDNTALTFPKALIEEIERLIFELEKDIQMVLTPVGV